jgi:hypothetical protein
MQFEADLVFKIVADNLPKAGIQAIMIGGHAVNHYGYSRATQDIDFMIAAEDADAVRTIMSDAGFANIAAHENVTFFSRPGSPLRVDFLKVARSTMNTLMANAQPVAYSGRRRVFVPQLRDLLGMKLFALSQGGAKREAKDFWDIVNLVIENGFDVETELQGLCRQFGNDALFGRLREQIEALRND